MAELTEKIERDEKAGPGRLLAIDLGARRVGLARCDELQISVTPLAAIERRSWKDLVKRVAALIDSTNAQGLVVGLPLSLDGTEGSAARETRSVAEKFRKSLPVPVYLQDERLTTFSADSHLRSAGRTAEEIQRTVDSTAAALILQDFINSHRD